MEVSIDPNMITETFPVGIFECNCTVLGDEETRRALVIDPGDEPQAILACLERLNLKLETILHTHAHIDHIGATKALAEATGAEVLLHPGDRFLYESAAAQAQAFGLVPPTVAPVDRWIEHGDEVRCGSIHGEILYTPGHSPGSVCLRIQGSAQGGDEAPRLYSGDTLFFGSIGRTDLLGGDMGAILRSIHERLMTLPDETLVIPGHGPMTEIGRERRTNPFIR